MTAFDVYGVPKPQGSARAFVANGKARITATGGTGFAAWRNAVADAARSAHGDQAPLDGPLRLTIAFRFPMPAARKKVDRERGWCWHTVAPDIDKLTRLVADALTAAGVIVDDARICSLLVTATEVHQAWTGAHVAIEVIEGP